MNIPVVVAIALLGAPVGSFLNVVIDRAPARLALRADPPERLEGDDDAPVVRPTERWMGVPVSPWLLRRRERSALPRRWLLVELATVAVFAVLAMRYADGDVLAARDGAESALVPLLVLGAALVAVTFVDLEHLRIPDRITFPGLGLIAAAIVAVSVRIDAEGALRAAALGAAVYFVLLLLPHLISPRGMGFGDVKLALPMGLVLGWVGWHPLAPTTGPLRLVLYALMLGSVLGVVFGLVHAGLTRRRGAFPFGPALALGCLVVVLFASDLRY